MTWKDENEMIRLRRLLDEACDLLYEHAVDPVTEEDRPEIRAFLGRADLREARL